MKTYQTFRQLLESINCKDINKFFKFSGTLQENGKAILIAKKLLRSGNEDLQVLFCCIESLKSNFCKSNIGIRIRDEDKMKICKELINITTRIKNKLKRDGILSIDCSKVH